MTLAAVEPAGGGVLPSTRALGGWHHPLLAMAAEAPSHGQRRHLTHAVHGLDRPVAALAGPTRAHVLAVVEVDEVRQVVHLGPAYGARLRHGLLELLHLGRCHTELAVAVHADAERGNARVPALLRREVAVE